MICIIKSGKSYFSEYHNYLNSCCLGNFIEYDAVDISQRELEN